MPKLLIRAGRLQTLKIFRNLHLSIYLDTYTQETIQGINSGSIISCRHITSTTEAWELSSLAHKLANIQDHLNSQLGICHQHIGEASHFGMIKGHNLNQSKLKSWGTQDSLCYKKQNIEVLYCISLNCPSLPLFSSEGLRNI